jgi:hypothetical protein
MDGQFGGAVADRQPLEDWQTAAVELRTALVEAVALIDRLEGRIEAVEKELEPTYATWEDAKSAGIPLG